ncbi:MAG: MFS transporter [Planctomycetota bacterium]|nr:MFS transporter [Planctomycetota bacterium]MDI6787254.1 MFS transporter [Planctomycetota bacterium]
MPDEFPPAHRRAALTISTWEGMFASFHGALIGGVFATDYILKLDAKNIHLAIFTAIPTLASVTQVLSAHWLQYLHQRKPLAIVTANISRFSWLLIALIPFIFIKSTALNIFFIIYLILNILIAMAGNVWLSWMADTIPPPLRGRYWSRRNLFCTIVAGITPLAGGYFITHLLPKLDKGLLETFSFLVPEFLTSQEQVIFIGYALIFFTAVLGGALPSLILLIKQYEPPFRKPSPQNLIAKTSAPLPEGENIKQPLMTYIRDISKDIVHLPNMRIFFVAMIIWSIINGFSVPFWLPYILRDLKMTVFDVTICGFLALITRTIALLFWGKLIDRFGNKTILIFTLYIVSFHPLFYVISSPGFTILIYLDFISSGIMWAGVEIATLNLLLGSAPKYGREMYYAIYAAITGLALTFPQFIGGWVTDLFTGYEFLSFSAVQILLWFVSVGRFLALIWVSKIVEPKEKPLILFISYLVGQIIGVLNFPRLFIQLYRNEKNGHKTNG